MLTGRGLGRWRSAEGLGAGGRQMDRALAAGRGLKVRTANLGLYQLARRNTEFEKYMRILALDGASANRYFLESRALELSAASIRSKKY